MTGSEYESTKSARQNSDVTRGGSYKAEFAVDGSGDWKLFLPADADEHDVLALAPVIKGVRSFLAPTVADADAPIEYMPVSNPDDLTA